VNAKRECVDGWVENNVGFDDSPNEFVCIHAQYGGGPLERVTLNVCKVKEHLIIVGIADEELEECLPFD
jgi:hypothetical protein